MLLTVLSFWTIMLTTMALNYDVLERAFNANGFKASSIDFIYVF